MTFIRFDKFKRIVFIVFSNIREVRFYRVAKLCVNLKNSKIILCLVAKITVI